MAQVQFEGRNYFRDKGTGYYRTSMREPDREYLHRAIYQSVYGNIPHGWHVHHKDEDPDNNVIENFECLPMKEHVHDRHKVMTTGLCDQCGKEYTRRRMGLPGRFCCNKCGTAWHNAQRKVKARNGT